MRIGIDNVSPGLSSLPRPHGGMRTYLQSLLAEFVHISPEDEFVLFTPAWAPPLLPEPVRNLRVITLPMVPINRALRVVYQQLALPIVAARAGLDVFFAPASVAPLLSAVPTVLSVQFLQFYDLPATYGFWRSRYLRTIVPASIRHARYGIIFTASAKRDLLQHVHVAEDRIRVIPHGLSEEIWAAAEMDNDVGDWSCELTAGRPYILYVSATYEYKNHRRLISAFAALKKQLNVPHVLVLAGAEYTISLGDLRSYAEELGMGDEVVVAGRVDDVASLYLGASLCAFPSLYETFGFPLLEAMALGCPVAASNTGSIAELAQDSAVLFDPRDESAMAAAMASVLADEAKRENLIARGRARAANYRWANSARETLALLKTAAIQCAPGVPREVVAKD